MSVEVFVDRFAAGLATLDDLPIAQARPAYDALCAGFAPPDPTGMICHDTVLARVAVRRFRPAKAASGRLLFLHGGGFTLGSVRSHHGMAASLAEQLGREVVSVDYRLAPEASYGDMLDDGLAVTRALSPLALVGDSAGGRLVMDLARKLEPAPPLGLIYPPVGGLSVTTLGPDAPLLSRADVLCIPTVCPGALPGSLEAVPPSSRMEVLAVEHDPLTRPLEAAVAAWRAGGAVVGYRCASGMVHAALHAQATLPDMQSAWQVFCQALNVAIEQVPSN